MLRDGEVVAKGPIGRHLTARRVSECSHAAASSNGARRPPQCGSHQRQQPLATVVI